MNKTILMRKQILLLLLSAWTLCSLAQGTDTLRLSLSKCREMAIEYNQQLKMADNAVVQAKLDREIAFANYLPKIDGQTMVGWAKDTESMGMTIMMKGFYMADIMLQQPLYAGGRIKAGNDLAKIGQQVSEEQLRLKQQEALLETDQAYWGYVSVLQKERMLLSYQEYMSALVDRVKVSVDAEMATGNELLRINAKKSEIDYNLQKVRTGVELCRMVLCNCIGCDLDQPILPADNEIRVEAPEGMDDDLSERPEMKLLDAAVNAKKKMVKLTMGEYLPSLGVGAAYMWYGGIKLKGYTEYMGTTVPYTQKMKDHLPFAMLSLNVPLWNWGESWKKVKKARIDVQNSELEREHNKRLLSIQVRQAILNVTDGYVQIETAERGLTQAKENLRVMRDKYEAGMATLTDLLDAQAQWQQAESNLIEAKTQYCIYKTEYLKAVGRL